MKRPSKNILIALIPLVIALLAAWKWHDIIKLGSNVIGARTTAKKTLFFHFADGSPARDVTVWCRDGIQHRPDASGNMLFDPKMSGSVISVRDANTSREITTVTVDSSVEIQHVLITESLLKPTNGSSNGLGTPVSN